MAVQVSLYQSPQVSHRVQFLAPVLFLYFVNDIPDCTLSKIRLYPDDILLYRAINTIDDCVKLQDDLHALQQWEKRWQMHFNPTKCHYIRLSNKHHLLDYNYNIHNISLKKVNTIKYLGVYIDNKLTWKSHVDAIVNKANSVIGFLSCNYKHCSPEQVLSDFDLSCIGVRICCLVTLPNYTY